MAFSDFKSVRQVRKLYPLQIRRQAFLPDVRLELPEWFLHKLNFALSVEDEGESEMFYREAFIYPFLQEAWERHPRLKLWVNQALEYDDKLFGEPDYFVAGSMDKQITDKTVGSPLVAVAEAKRQDFDLGWGQCLAEMVACRELNAERRTTVFGIVFTGIIWQFGKLEGQVFTRDPRPQTVFDPQRLMGWLEFVFAECEKQLDAPPAQSSPSN